MCSKKLFFKDLRRIIFLNLFRIILLNLSTVCTYFVRLFPMVIKKTRLPDSIYESPVFFPIRYSNVYPVYRYALTRVAKNESPIV